MYYTTNGKTGGKIDNETDRLIRNTKMKFLKNWISFLIKLKNLHLMGLFFTKN